MLTRYINRARAWLQAGARTVGLSPKALAPVVGAALLAGLNAVGVSPHDLAHAFGVSDTVAAGAVTTVASAIAAWLLPPGAVVAPAGEVGEGNDARLGTAGHA